MLTTGKTEERKTLAGNKRNLAKGKTIKQLKLEDLSDIDRKVLVSLYRYRCLDDVLLEKYCFKGEASMGYRFRKLGSFIEKNRYEKKVYYCLTTKGVNMVRLICGLSGEGLPTAYRIKMSGKAVEHQLALNGFVMEFEDRAEEKGFTEYEYFDEIYQINYETIRPDGVLSVPDHTIFIEIDMGTERKSQLRKKWDRYYKFTNTKEFFDSNKPFQVLFVSLKEKNAQQRIDAIQDTIYTQHFGTLRTGLFIHVGSKEEMLDTIFGRLIPGEGLTGYKNGVQRRLKEKGFTLAEGSSIASELGGEMYDFFMRKLDDRGRLEIAGGRPQQFLVDVFGKGPFSELRKIELVAQNTVGYISKTGLGIGYIIVVDNLDSFYYKLKQINCLNVPNVFYTTTKLLKHPDQELYKCLRCYDSIGRILRFTDASLSNTEYMRDVKDRRHL